jgi:formate-dependent nitrite reductase membrane component NrfD
VNAFHVCGGILAIWALTLSFLGITREEFPASKATARLVGGISVLLVVAAIFSAIYTGATEEHEKEGGGETGALLPF